MKTVTKDFTYRGRHFAIIKHEGHYCAIDYKFIDSSGKLTKELHGGQMFASKDLPQCMENIKNALDLEHYVGQGMTKGEAMCKVFNLPIEMAGKLNDVI